MPDGGPRAARLVVLRASNAQNFTHTERTLWHVSHLRDRLPDAGTRLPEAFCDTAGTELLHRDPADDGDGDVSLHLDTQVGFLYGSYRLVVSLDMTRACFAVSSTHPTPLFERIFPALKTLLWSLCRRISLSAQDASPRLFVSVVAQGELVDAVLPLVQGFLLTHSTFGRLAELLEPSITALQEVCIERMRGQAHTPSQPPASASESFQSTMEQAAFALKLLPAAAAPFMVIVTAGGSSTPPGTAYDGLLMQLQRHDMQCHVLMLEDEETAASGGVGPGTVAFVDTAHFVARATSACVLRASALAAAADAISQPQLGLQKGRSAAPRALAAMSVAVQWRALLRWSWAGARRSARPIRDPPFELWAVGGGREAHAAAGRIFLTALTPEQEQGSTQAETTERAAERPLPLYLPGPGAQQPLTLVRTRVSAYVFHASPAAALVLRSDEGFRVRRLSKHRGHSLLTLVHACLPHAAVEYVLGWRQQPGEGGPLVHHDQRKMRVQLYVHALRPTAEEVARLVARRPTSPPGARRSSSWGPPVGVRAQAERLTSFCFNVHLTDRVHAYLRHLPASLSTAPPAAGPHSALAPASLHVLSQLPAPMWHRWFKVERIELCATRPLLPPLARMAAAPLAHTRGTASRGGGAFPLPHRSGDVADAETMWNMGRVGLASAPRRGGTGESLLLGVQWEPFSSASFHLGAAATAESLRQLCERWSTAPISPTTFLRLLPRHQPTDGAAETGNPSSSSAAAEDASAGPFCFLRVGWPSPQLATIHLAFFSTPPSQRVAVCRALARTITLAALHADSVPQRQGASDAGPRDAPAGPGPSPLVAQPALVCRMLTRRAVYEAPHTSQPSAVAEGFSPAALSAVGHAARLEDGVPDPASPLGDGGGVVEAELEAGAEHDSPHYSPCCGGSTPEAAMLLSYLWRREWSWQPVDESVAAWTLHAFVSAKLQRGWTVLRARSATEGVVLGRFVAVRAFSIHAPARVRRSTSSSSSAARAGAGGAAAAVGEGSAARAAAAARYTPVLLQYTARCAPSGVVCSEVCAEPVQGYMPALPPRHWGAGTVSAAESPRQSAPGGNGKEEEGEDKKEDVEGRGPRSELPLPPPLPAAGPLARPEVTFESWFRDYALRIREEDDWLAQCYTSLRVLQRECSRRAVERAPALASAPVWAPLFRALDMLDERGDVDAGVERRQWPQEGHQTAGAAGTAAEAVADRDQWPASEASAGTGLAGTEGDDSEGNATFATEGVGSEVSRRLRAAAAHTVAPEAGGGRDDDQGPGPDSAASAEDGRPLLDSSRQPLAAHTGPLLPTSLRIMALCTTAQRGLLRFPMLRTEDAASEEAHRALRLSRGNLRLYRSLAALLQASTHGEVAWPLTGGARAAAEGAPTQRRCFVRVLPTGALLLFFLPSARCMRRAEAATPAEAAFQRPGPLNPAEAPLPVHALPHTTAKRARGHFAVSLFAVDARSAGWTLSDQASAMVGVLCSLANVISPLRGSHDGAGASPLPTRTPSRGPELGRRVLASWRERLSAGEVELIDEALRHTVCAGEGQERQSAWFVEGANPAEAADPTLRDELRRIAVDAATGVPPSDAGGGVGHCISLLRALYGRALARCCATELRTAVDAARHSDRAEPGGDGPQVAGSDADETGTLFHLVRRALRPHLAPPAPVPPSVPVSEMRRAVQACDSSVLLLDLTFLRRLHHAAARREAALMRARRPMPGSWAPLPSWFTADSEGGRGGQALVGGAAGAPCGLTVPPGKPPASASPTMHALDAAFLHALRAEFVPVEGAPYLLWTPRGRISRGGGAWEAAHGLALTAGAKSEDGFLRMFVGVRSDVGSGPKGVATPRKRRSRRGRDKAALESQSRWSGVLAARPLSVVGENDDDDGDDDAAEEEMGDEVGEGVAAHSVGEEGSSPIVERGGAESGASATTATLEGQTEGDATAGEQHGQPLLSTEAGEIQPAVLVDGPSPKSGPSAPRSSPLFVYLECACETGDAHMAGGRSAASAGVPVGQSLSRAMMTAGPRLLRRRLQHRVAGEADAGAAATQANKGGVLGLVLGAGADAPSAGVGEEVPGEAAGEGSPRQGALGAGGGSPLASPALSRAAGGVSFSVGPEAASSHVPSAAAAEGSRAGAMSPVAGQPPSAAGRAHALALHSALEASRTVLRVHIASMSALEEDLTGAKEGAGSPHRQTSPVAASTAPEVLGPRHQRAVQRLRQAVVASAAMGVLRCLLTSLPLGSWAVDAVRKALALAPQRAVTRERVPLKLVPARAAARVAAVKEELRSCRHLHVQEVGSTFVVTTPSHGEEQAIAEAAGRFSPGEDAEVVVGAPPEAVEPGVTPRSPMFTPSAPISAYSVPYWLLLSATDSHVSVTLHHPPGSVVWQRREAILQDVRDALTRLADRANRAVLLRQLHDSLTASPLLTPTAAPVPAGFRPGQFACPLQRTLRVSIHRRLVPAAALKQLAVKALQPFAVSGYQPVQSSEVADKKGKEEKEEAKEEEAKEEEGEVAPPALRSLPRGPHSLFVYRIQRGPIIYMTLALVSRDEDEGAGPVEAELRVFGLEPVPASVTTQLQHRLQAQITAQVLGKMADAVGSVRALRLGVADVEFLAHRDQVGPNAERPGDEEAAAGSLSSPSSGGLPPRVSIFIPLACDDENAHTVLTALRQQLLQHMRLPEAATGEKEAVLKQIAPALEAATSEQSSELSAGDRLPIDPWSCCFVCTRSDLPLGDHSSGDAEKRWHEDDTEEPATPQAGEAVAAAFARHCNAEGLSASALGLDLGDATGVADRQAPGVGLVRVGVVGRRAVAALHEAGMPADASSTAMAAAGRLRGAEWAPWAEPLQCALGWDRGEIADVEVPAGGTAGHVRAEAVSRWLSLAPGAAASALVGGEGPEGQFVTAHPPPERWQVGLRITAWCRGDLAPAALRDLLLDRARLAVLCHAADRAVCPPLNPLQASLSADAVRRAAALFRVLQASALGKAAAACELRFPRALPAWTVAATASQLSASLAQWAGGASSAVFAPVSVSAALGERTSEGDEWVAVPSHWLLRDQGRAGPGPASEDGPEARAAWQFSRQLSHAAAAGRPGEEASLLIVTRARHEHLPSAGLSGVAVPNVPAEDSATPPAQRASAVHWPEEGEGEGGYSPCPSLQGVHRHVLALASVSHRGVTVLVYNASQSGVQALAQSVAEAMSWSSLRSDLCASVVFQKLGLERVAPVEGLVVHEAGAHVPPASRRLHLQLASPSDAETGVRWVVESGGHVRGASEGGADDDEPSIAVPFTLGTAADLIRYRTFGELRAAEGSPAPGFGASTGDTASPVPSGQGQGAANAQSGQASGETSAGPSSAPHPNGEDARAPQASGTPSGPAASGKKEAAPGADAAPTKRDSDAPPGTGSSSSAPAPSPAPAPTPVPTPKGGRASVADNSRGQHLHADAALAAARMRARGTPRVPANLGVSAISVSAALGTPSPAAPTPAESSSRRGAEEETSIPQSSSARDSSVGRRPLSPGAGAGGTGSDASPGSRVSGADGGDGGENGPLASAHSSLASAPSGRSLALMLSAFSDFGVGHAPAHPLCGSVWEEEPDALQRQAFSFTQAASARFRFMRRREVVRALWRQWRAGEAAAEAAANQAVRAARWVAAGPHPMSPQARSLLAEAHRTLLVDMDAAALFREARPVTASSTPVPLLRLCREDWAHAGGEAVTGDRSQKHQLWRRLASHMERGLAKYLLACTGSRRLWTAGQEATLVVHSRDAHAHAVPVLSLARSSGPDPLAPLREMLPTEALEHSAGRGRTKGGVLTASGDALASTLFVSCQQASVALVRVEVTATALRCEMRALSLAYLFAGAAVPAGPTPGAPGAESGRGEGAGEGATRAPPSPLGAHLAAMAALLRMPALSYDFHIAQVQAMAAVLAVRAALESTGPRRAVISSREPFLRRVANTPTPPAEGFPRAVASIVEAFSRPPRHARASAALATLSMGNTPETVSLDKGDLFASVRRAAGVHGFLDLGEEANTIMWLSPNGHFIPTSTVNALAPFLPVTRQQGAARRRQEAARAGSHSRRGLFVLLLSPSPQMVAGEGSDAGGDSIAYMLFRISAEDASFLDDLAQLGWEHPRETPVAGAEPSLLTALGHARKFLWNTLARAAAETRRDAAWAELWRSGASEAQRGDALATLKATACRVSITTDEDAAELLHLPLAWDEAAPWLCAALRPHAAVARSRSGRTNIVLRPAADGDMDYLVRIALPRRDGGVRVQALVRELLRTQATGLTREIQKLAHTATDTLAAWAVGHCM